MALEYHQTLKTASRKSQATKITHKIHLLQTADAPPLAVKRQFFGTLAVFPTSHNFFGLTGARGLIYRQARLSWEISTLLFAKTSHSDLRRWSELRQHFDQNGQY